MGGRPESLGSISENRCCSVYMNALKQASFLRFSSANPIMEMKQSDQTGLWKALKEQDMSKVEDCLKSTNFNTSEMKYVPVRLFVANSRQPIQFRVKRILVSKESDNISGSTPIVASGGTKTEIFGRSESTGTNHRDRKTYCSRMVTLGDLLASWVPDYPLPSKNTVAIVD